MNTVDMTPPDWAVTCALVPRTVHVRNEGHACDSPLLAVFDSQFNLVPAPKPCKSWCGTTDYEKLKRAAYYSRKGVYYCRSRCVTAAIKAERPRTPASTGKAGEG